MTRESATLRFLLFSDIHGNVQALDAVLVDSTRHGPYDLIVCAGDLVWAGPRPQEVMARMRELCGDNPADPDCGAICLLGNCDRFLLPACDDALPPGKQGGRFREHRRWMLEKLTSADLEFLQRLPASLELEPASGRSLLAVHANPYNLDDPIYPQMEDSALAALLGDAQFEVLVFGHIHIPFVRLWRGRLLVNVASAGQPRDGDTRAAYSVLTWTGDGWSVSQYRVEYDVEAVAADMRDGGLPRGAHFAKRLLAARYN